MDFDWILFDADHTLFDFDKSARSALSATLRENRIADPGHFYEIYRDINARCWHAFEEGQIDATVLRHVRFELFFDAIELEHPDPVGFNDAYLSKLPELPYFMDGAMEALKRWRGFYKYGLITNGLKEVQRPRLEFSGLISFFDIVVISGEIGLAKPDNAYFDHAHSLMGRPEKSRVLVIGDNLNSDISGGQSFGFRTCWYNPGSKDLDGAVKPDFQIAHFRELDEILGLS